jgi:hypothetical protein
MDPYLEGYLWPDLHHRLATYIANQLTPQIAPRYVARIVVRTIIEEVETGITVSIRLPDVELITAHQARRQPAHRQSAASAVEPLTPATMTVAQPLAVEVEIPSVEIRDVAGGLLVTSIEILSPANKYGSGWDEYQKKRQQVIHAQANLLEIDLLRRGRRPLTITSTPLAAYYLFLTRAGEPTRADVWAIQVRDRLPTVPVPLRPPDDDVPLNLQRAFASIYDEARYDLSLDYSNPPEYPLQGADALWAAQLLKHYYHDDQNALNGTAGE